jgi:hypothetical protein
MLPQTLRKILKLELLLTTLFPCKKRYFYGNLIFLKETIRIPYAGIRLSKYFVQKSPGDQKKGF